MSMTRPIAAAVAATLALGVCAPSAFAVSAYPTQSCVSAKQKSAAKKCKLDLTAWSKWEVSQDSVTRDASLAASATKFSDAWTKADDKATAKGVNCSDATGASGDTASAMDAGINDIVTSINSGLTLPADGKCGAALIKAAAKKCNAFLKAESKFVGKPTKDPQGVALAAAKAKASTKFSDAFAKALPGCPTTATASVIETKVDALNDTVVTDTTVSQAVPTAWTAVNPPAGVSYQGANLFPVCSRNTPYQYFVKRGTGADARKLLMYYQGGGACWDSVTCASATGAFDDDVMPSDNPANTTTGFGDLTNTDNPFRNWSAVFVSYCTGDIHWGDHPGTAYNFGGAYTIQHVGYQNAKVVEKWAREHFVNPTEVFVTGSSAGAYGAILHGIFLHDVYPASRFNVIGDAGNGVITQEFLQNDLEPAWHVQQHLPTYIPGLDADVTTLTIADLYGKASQFYQSRGSRFGQYTTAYDGGGGSQTFFYNVMVNSVLDAGSWWHSSCAWNDKMIANDIDAAGQAPMNYRYYIGPGSRHTIYGSNRVYTEIHGGVPTFVQWLNDMRAGTPGWTNVACTDCSNLGSCVGGGNAGASCQHDSECPGGVCNIVDAKPPFTCSPASSNPGASCQRDADCPGGACQVEASFGVCTSNNVCIGGANAGAACTNDSECPGGACSIPPTADKLCSTNGDCTTGTTCVTQQPYQLDGVITCN